MTQQRIYDFTDEDIPYLLYVMLRSGKMSRMSKAWRKMLTEVTIVDTDTPVWRRRLEVSRAREDRWRKRVVVGR